MTCCLQEREHWCYSFRVLGSTELGPIRPIQVDISARKNKENCPFWEQDTLKRVMYHVFEERKLEQSFLGDENTLMWKKRRNISEKCVLALLLKGALCRHVTKRGGCSMVFHGISRVPQAEPGSPCGFRRQN